MSRMSVKIGMGVVLILILGLFGGRMVQTFIGMALVAVALSFLGARVVQASVQKLIGFEPSYRTAWKATLAGYALGLVLAIGLILVASLVDHLVHLDNGQKLFLLSFAIIGLLIFWVWLQVMIFNRMLTTPEGASMGLLKALLVNLSQMAAVCASLLVLVALDHVFYFSYYFFQIFSLLYWLVVSTIFAVFPV